jgi:hypothetical protein
LAGVARLTLAQTFLLRGIGKQVQAEARAIDTDIANGVDPRAKDRAANAKQAAAQADTVRAVCDRYLDKEGRNLRPTTIAHTPIQRDRCISASG